MPRRPPDLPSRWTDWQYEASTNPLPRLQPLRFTAAGATVALGDVMPGVVIALGTVSGGSGFYSVTEVRRSVNVPLAEPMISDAGVVTAVTDAVPVSAGEGQIDITISDDSDRVADLSVTLSFDWAAPGTGIPPLVPRAFRITATVRTAATGGSGDTPYRIVPGAITDVVIGYFEVSGGPPAGDFQIQAQYGSQVYSVAGYQRWRAAFGVSVQVHYNAAERRYDVSFAGRWSRFEAAGNSAFTLQFGWSEESSVGRLHFNLAWDAYVDPGPLATPDPPAQPPVRPPIIVVPETPAFAMDFDLGQPGNAYDFTDYANRGVRYGVAWKQRYNITSASRRSLAYTDRDPLIPSSGVEMVVQHNLSRADSEQQPDVRFEILVNWSEQSALWKALFPSGASESWFLPSVRDPMSAVRLVASRPVCDLQRVPRVQVARRDVRVFVASASNYQQLVLGSGSTRSAVFRFPMSGANFSPTIAQFIAVTPNTVSDLDAPWVDFVGLMFDPPPQG